MKLSHFVTGFSVLLCSTLTASQNTSENAATARKPNVVFILTDDQDLHMNSLDHMPKVQELLINQGTSYMRHYAPTALCCPARVSIWTGLHSHNHGVASVHNGPYGGWDKIVKQGLNDKYLPIWLRNNGYRTYYAGKLYNGMDKETVENETAKGWTEADLLVGPKVYQYNDPSFQHIENNHWQNPGKVIDQPGNYSTNKVGEYAFGYLRDALSHDDPFFVGIAPITPHVETGKPNKGPPVPAKKYKGTLPNVNVPLSGNFKSTNRSGVNFVWELEPLNTHQLNILKDHYQARTEALLSVDDIVEQVVDILKQHNQLDNTYIIYSSDNGFHLGQHRLGPGKKFAFEEDINVPLIIRGPDVPKNKKTDIVTAHVDLAPTILHMASVPQRDDFDGRPIPLSAADIDQRENSDADEYTGVEFWEGASFKFNKINGTKFNSYKSLRLSSKDYDIMYAVQCLNNSHELYNMKKDAVQMRNLHPNAPHEPGQKNAYNYGETKLAGYDIKRLLQRVDALLLVLKSCKASSCIKPWHELHPNADVKNLKDAMDSRWDEKYEDLYTHKNVSFTKCYRDGTIDIGSEGPQWKGNDQVDVVSMNELNQTNFTTDDDENFSLGWEDEGYWDDWE